MTAEEILVGLVWDNQKVPEIDDVYAYADPSSIVYYDFAVWAGSKTDWHRSSQGLIRNSWEEAKKVGQALSELMLSSRI